MDSVKQSLAGGETGQSSCCRVAVCVDPERWPVVHEQVIEDKRLENRDTSATFDIQECHTSLQ
jgi:hypothetical protein